MKTESAISIARYETGNSVGLVTYGEETMSNGNKMLVILNVDDARKAHAARFNAGEEGAVRKAAGLMGMRLGVAKTDKALELARKLPEGKLFDSGKGMVPLVREDIYYALCANLTFDQAWTSRGVVTGADSSPDSTTLKAADAYWATVKIGSTVLVFDYDEPEFPLWSAAIVTGIARDGETLTARWRDYPALKPFTVQRQSVGLLRPNIAS